MQSMICFTGMNLNSYSTTAIYYSPEANLIIYGYIYLTVSLIKVKQQIILNKLQSWITKSLSYIISVISKILFRKKQMTMMFACKKSWSSLTKNPSSKHLHATCQSPERLAMERPKGFPMLLYSIKLRKFFGRKYKFGPCVTWVWCRLNFHWVRSRFTS